MDTRMRYVTVKEAARMLNVVDSHIRRMAGAGKLRGTKWNSSWMIELEDVMEYRKYRTSHNKGRPRS